MLQLMEKMNLLDDFYIFNFFLFKFLHESFETFLSDIIQVKNESFLNVILFTDILRHLCTHLYFVSDSGVTYLRLQIYYG